MLWLYLDIAVAVIFRDIQRGLYLGRRQEEIIMTPYPEEALDLSIQDTEPKSISSLLSLGTKALAVEQNTSKIHIDDIEFKSRNQFFRIILVSSGSYVFQHNDLCVGYSSNFAHRLVDATNNSPYFFVEMVECTDIQNTIHFLKSEKIDGEIKSRKVIENGSFEDKLTKKKDSQVFKIEEQAMKSEETNFLRGVLGKVTHLF